MTQAPAVVTLHLWGVPARHVPLAVLRMGLDRRALRRTSGLRFAKLMGTGNGRTFTVRDSDPRHWALLAAWEDAASARQFEASRTAATWRSITEETLRVELQPLASRGLWSGRTPFGSGPNGSGTSGTSGASGARYDGAVAAVTRARLAPRKALAFWRSVPPVAADLHRSPGLRLAVGIGEAPIGLQGTFSLWDSARALTDFGYRRSPHIEAIRQTAQEQWYAEELFARFAVLDVAGTFAGRTP